MLETVAKSTQAAAQSLRVRSALNPMLWLTSIATPVCFVAAYVFQDAQGVLITTAVLPIAVTCLGFVYFAIAKPEKLQSEDYQLRHESLQLLQAKSGTITVDPGAVTAIANPALPALPPSQGPGQ